MSDANQGVVISQEGGFSKFAWMLIAAFGTILLLISSAALSKLWSVSDRVAEQAGDIKVILANQANQDRNTDGLADELKMLRTKVDDIERRQAQVAGPR